MLLYFRFLWAAFTGLLFKGRIPPHGPASRNFLILPFLDAETVVSLNGVRYLGFCEITQMECNLRSGLVWAGIKKGFWCVTAANTIYYRRPIRSFSWIRVTSELIGWEGSFAIWENTFYNKKKELCALSYTRVTVRGKKGAINISEVHKQMGVEPYYRQIRPDIAKLFEDFQNTFKAGPSSI